MVVDHLRFPGGRAQSDGFLDDVVKLNPGGDGLRFWIINYYNIAYHRSLIGGI